jgi:hypothetical protein
MRKSEKKKQSFSISLSLSLFLLFIFLYEYTASVQQSCLSENVLLYKGWQGGYDTFGKAPSVNTFYFTLYVV